MNKPVLTAALVSSLVLLGASGVRADMPDTVAQLPGSAVTASPTPDTKAAEPTAPNTPNVFNAPANGESEPGSEEPRVTAVSVEGNREVPVNEILSQVNTRIGDAVDQKQIARDVQAIYDLGYFTDVKVETELQPGGVQVIYRVFENPDVKQVQITGNSLVTTDKLLSLMETHPGHILNTKTLYADVSVINRYYDNELGYLLEPTHVTALNMQPDGTLKMTIQEGMVIKGIQITGVTVFPQSQVKALLKAKPGDLFNQNVVKDDTNRIASLYEDNDYILDTIKPGINKDTGVVTYQILEATVERIRVEGNTKTHEDVILRNIYTKPGDVLRKKRLQKDLERLNNLGFFESVHFDPEPGSAPGKVVLVVKLKEAKTGLATLGLGYSGGGNGALRAGVTGAVSFAEKNLGGTGQSASVQWQRGVNIDSVGFNYYDPSINTRQDSFGFTVFSQSLDELEEPIAGASVGSVNGYALYDDRDVGASVTFGRLLTEDLRAFVTIKRESIDITEDPLSQFIPVGLGRGDINSVALAGLYDTRDDIFNPHKGTFVNVGVVGAGGPLGGSFQYTKLQGEVRKYFPLKKDRTIATRFWAGTINGTAPVTEFFFLGGIDTLRGYQDNSLLGTSFILANAEFRFPLAKLKLLSGAVFAEAGNAYNNGTLADAITLNNGRGVLYDGGLGLRLVYPSLGLGVIRLDYAVGQDGGRTSVGIGQSF